jgi:hypothetical protein
LRAQITAAMPMTMKMMYDCTKSDSHMTMRVGNGSSAPRPLNIFAKVGMTKIIMKMMTRNATLMMVMG